MGECKLAVCLEICISIYPVTNCVPLPILEQIATLEENLAGKIEIKRRYFGALLHFFTSSFSFLSSISPVNEHANARSPRCGLQSNEITSLDI